MDVNPFSTLRSGEITVFAGNTDGGPTGIINVNQAGSTFTVDREELMLAGTAATLGSVKVRGTNGLCWRVSPSTGTNGITPAATTFIADGNLQTLTFNATKNPGSSVREATFTISVVGGDHSRTVKVSQQAYNTLTIDQAIADVYRDSCYNALTSHPPFNYDQGIVTGTLGNDYKGVSSTCTIDTPYTIEVEETQSDLKYRYVDGAARDYCADKGRGWRLPTIIELFAMWKKCKGANNNASDDEPESNAFGEKFIYNPDDPNIIYWSSTVYNGNSERRSRLFFNTGKFTNNITEYGYYIRCVRTLE